MDLDFEPIARDEEGNRFVMVDDGFDFDESEKDFLRELTESIPEESKLDSSKAVGVI
jgi:hypothetical protein